MELAQADSIDIGPFVSHRPLIKGTIYTLRRKCSKPSCRCTRGALHESCVLSASIAGKTRLWSVSPEHKKELETGTRAYRGFRRARAQFLKQHRQRERDMLTVIDRIEHLRLREP